MNFEICAVGTSCLATYDLSFGKVTISTLFCASFSK
jgi:hypothetical protein